MIDLAFKSTTSSTAGDNTSSRRGFTLLELMLVVAVIVVLMLMAMPSINRTFSRQALDKSADRLRAAMGKARVQAMQEGDVYAVYLERGGRWFEVASYSSAKQQIEKSQRRASDMANRAGSNFEENLLPDGIEFATGEVALSARSASVTSGAKTLSGNLQQVLFYPDGTSQDAKVMLQNEYGGVVEVQLRGLTGIAKSVRLERRR